MLEDDDDACTQEEALKNDQKCDICDYSVLPFDYYFCRNCKKFFHQKCFNDQHLDNKDYLIDDSSNSWCCYDCRECKYCLSFKDRSELLTCTECKKLFHSYCTFVDNTGNGIAVTGKAHKNNNVYTFENLYSNNHSLGGTRPQNSNEKISNELDYKSPLKGQGQNLVENKTGKCDECSRCFNCYSFVAVRTQTPNQENLAVAGLTQFCDKNVCENCLGKYQLEEYCPCCLKTITEKIKIQKNKKFHKSLIRCECKFWIHRSCDPL